MGRMDRIDESDRLIVAHRVEQVLVFVDEDLPSGSHILSPVLNMCQYGT
jgi:hypothetical protein